MKTSEGLEITHAFAAPGASNIIDVIHPTTQLGGYSNLSLAQMREREKNPAIEIVSLADFCAAKAAQQDSPVTWTETTAERFWEMLEVLPPAYYMDGGFLVGEPVDHHAGNGRPRFEGFLQIREEKFFASSRPMTTAEFKIEAEKFFAARAEAPNANPGV